MKERRRCLWRVQEASALRVEESSFDEIFQRFASKPRRKRTLFWYCANNVVVLQELALTCFVLAQHRIQLLQVQRQHHVHWVFDYYYSMFDASAVTIFVALFLSIFYSARADQSHQQDRKTKILQRSTDAILLAVILRLLASVLQSLTASYSSDTVDALAISGFVVHLVCCDYSYANGRKQKSIPTAPNYRLPFQGGTISLNAALFSTTLLVSRLQTSAYFFVSMAVIIFAFYPLTRHAISVSYPASLSGKSHNALGK
jgi:hypothetical protein